MRLAFLAALLVAACSSPIAVLHHVVPSTPTPAPPVGALTHEDLEPVINAVQGDPDNFAGVWWDRSGWPLHVAIKSTDPQMRAKVEQWLPAGAFLEWHQVRYSYAELDAPQNWFMSWWDADPTAHPDLDVNAVSVDVVRNVTTFSLVRHVPWFESDVRSRYGDAVEFVIEPKPEPI